MSVFWTSQEERDQLLRDLAGRKQRKEKLLVELEKYKACDPEVMELMKQQTLMAKEAANRWTGNMILLLCHFPIWGWRIEFLISTFSALVLLSLLLSRSCLFL